ncbi:mucin-5AC isoform X2 [Drosophila albomicans]|uniref:Mucin-5AC isoform X1 n=2 Tax=Drosophila albomicans TaxID=7291 RepID=A0A6P8W6W5_DROAB|nr:mucin-5AC isoform X1 [Drosophila albomicans]XP_051858956.1 mucin-5AC isoform X2 [Drosophila albomicans]
MTMRSSTGSERSSSQLSIYDYPEHLNPFADDDNHKRLRFWSLSKRGDNRRRSFSVGNLKELWPLKTFSLRKKKSSTLGIQKTSESPPVLRRSLEPNSLYPGDQAFRRQYTNSLQNINTPRGLRSSGTNFSPVHNPHQRSTISEGYLTPLSQRYHPTRSSQTSLVSSNPFESDIESDATDIGSVSLGGVRKSYRKKRRAPLAPTKEMLSKTSTPVNGKQEDSELKAEQNKAIRSLAVEIEQFVNNSNETSTAPIPTVVVESPSPRPESPQTTNNNSEPPIFAKVRIPSKSTESDPSLQEGTITITTVTCTSTIDPVTEIKTVQIDSNLDQNTKSSPVAESPKIERKFSGKKIPPKPPVRSHFTKSENKLQSIERTSSSKPVTEFDEPSSSSVKIIETSFVSKTPQTEPKILEQTSSPASPSRSSITRTEPEEENKLQNVEYTLTNEQSAVLAKVKIVESSTAIGSPQHEPKIPQQQTSSPVPPRRRSIAKENKIQIVEPIVKALQIDESTSSSADTVSEVTKTDSKIVSSSIAAGSNDKQAVETKTVKFIESSQTEHKIADQTNLPKPTTSELPLIEETKIANTEHTLTNVAGTGNLPEDRINRQPLSQSSERKGLNNLSTAQKYCFKENNNAENYEYLNKPLTIFENSERKSERPDDGGAQPKPKSVKEIIDSINRSQKLLKDSAAKGTTVYSTALYTENNNIGPISNQRSSQVPSEISPNILTASSSGAPLENEQQVEENYFQKSKINKTAFQYRESSPTALNLDWNPLPKPKRINNGSST